ncbi:hypothetical protein SLEP1_g31342 [Rubroshorea leprosula]|uniref:Uncharacterized protein n=1 Tax=Rubroshorea leprosula TaxID=152421 RepID=A0AAV5KAN9_9ROSI|nr:hypothetical protein SLEP1_g31342 [Rubroshorea leprosula]
MLDIVNFVLRSKLPELLSMNLVSSEPCAFVGPSHKCTASATSPDLGSGA